MWIERIKVERFVLFDEKEFSFSEGFNLILAPNEKGKSTLFRAVLVLLYSSVFSSSRKLSTFKRWGSEGMFRLEGVVHMGSGSYRLVKDFGEKKQEVFEYPSGKSIVKGRAVDEFLRSRLTFPSEELFLRVCAVRHEELDGVSAGSRKIGERIERILGGGWGENSPEEVEKALSRYRAQLVRGEERYAKEENWGPIKKLSEDVSELERKLVAARDSAEKERGLREELSRLVEETERLKEEIDIAAEKVERAKKLRKLEEDMKRLDDEAREIHRRLMRIDKLEKELSSHEKRGEEFPEQLRNLDVETLTEYRLLLKREMELAEQVDKLKEIKVSATPLILLGLSAAMAAAGIVGLLVSGLFWIMVAAGLVGLGVSIGWLSRVRRPRREMKEKIKEINGLEEKRRQWSSGLSAEQAIVLVDEVLTWKSDYEEYVARADENIRGEDGNVESLWENHSDRFSVDPLESLKKLKYMLTDKFSAIAVSVQAHKGEIEKLEPFKLEPDELIKTEKALETKAEELERLEDRRRRIEVELSSLVKLDMVEISDELEFKRDRLKRVQRRLQAVEEAIDALEEARRSFAGYLADGLPPVVSDYVQKMTNGRYDEITIDPLTLETRVLVSVPDSEGAEGNSLREVEPDLLSRGTRDQVYLAVRLGLVRLLGRQETLPILLDDPLVHFDPERRRSAMKLLEELSGEHQVLFFSCDLERSFPDVHRVEI